MVELYCMVSWVKSPTFLTISLYIIIQVKNKMLFIIIQIIVKNHYN